MLIQVRARFGVLSDAEIQGIAAKCAGKLRSRTDYDWLTPGCIEQEVEKLPFSFSSSLHRVMCRAISTKVSIFLLKRVAGSLGLELRGGRAVDKTAFLVHDFMFPSYLFEDHAGHLRHPRKEWDFWYARPHRAWVDRAYEMNGLEAGMVRAFETEYCDWIGREWLEEISHAVHPLYAKAYRVVSAR